MLIIIDGPDCSGKSTLARELAAQLGAAYPGDAVELRHCGPPSGDPLDEYERPLYRYLPGRSRHVIYDRHYVGEWVYPEVFGRSSVADRAMWLHIEAFLTARGALLVQASTDPTELAIALDHRGDELVNPKQIQQICELFEERFTASTLSSYSYDYVAAPVTAVADIIALARQAEARVVDSSHLITYVGPRWPNYLLLGDVRHDLRNVDIAAALAGGQTLDGPAFVPKRGTSGSFILNHLPDILVGNVGLLNACDVDDPEAAWRLLGEPAAVALGANAWRRTGGSNGFAVAAVPHPQWVRRFAHSHGAEYGRLILESAETRQNNLSWRP